MFSDCDVPHWCEPGLLDMEASYWPLATLVNKGEAVKTDSFPSFKCGTNEAGEVAVSSVTKKRR